MKKNHETFLSLKTILENSQHPETLDSHPWIESLFFQDVLSKNPSLNSLEPGKQLVFAVAKIFQGMMPNMPPKQGKRLDPRWEEFGLLAALYFAPLEFGVPFPVSMRDAWGCIDASIRMFAEKLLPSTTSDDEYNLYKLVSDEPTTAPASTLSDWHRKGIRRLLEIIVAREQYLRVNTESTHSISNHKRKLLRKGGRALLVAFSIVLFAGTFFFVWKVKRIYLLTEKIRQDVSLVSEVANSTSLIKSANSLDGVLPKISADVKLLHEEIRPFFQVTNRLGWVPKYGSDLAALQDLLFLTDQTVQTADQVYLALSPTLSLIEEKNSAIDFPTVLHQLQDAQPQFLEARQAIQQVLSVRENLNIYELSPEIRQLLLTEFDPLLSILDDGVAGALALPQVLGASEEGPKTYLLLVENEDELRPTGGFITAVGNIVVSNGKILSMSFEDSGGQEDWDKPYPAAPWQLQNYMNSRVLVLRDSNWFTDFPTSALYAEHLYSYTHAHSVDGVIAFNQQVLILLLRSLGAVNVEGAPESVTAENVVPYMRAAKLPPPIGFRQPGEERKEFISKIADAILDKILSADNADLEELGKMVWRSLDERHLLVQFDNELMSDLSKKHNWDGSLQADQGDFLMIVDSNIGFNKTNAIVSRNMIYDVDLTNLNNPRGSLLVTHTNHGSDDVPCIQWGGNREGTDNLSYPIDRCYWNYFRVYVREGASLINATPHKISGEWMILGKDVPAKVDALEEKLDGVKGYGTLLVVPGSETISTGFDFSLPTSVVRDAQGSDYLIYKLVIKKQPGVLTTPTTIRIHLPRSVIIESLSQQATVEGSDILIETDLRTDMEFRVLFSIPKDPN